MIKLKFKCKNSEKNSYKETSFTKHVRTIHGEKMEINCEMGSKSVNIVAEIVDL